MMHAIDPELKVQVGAGCPACCAYGTYILSLRNRLTHLDANAAKVCVYGCVIIAVLDKNDIAKAVLHTGKLNHTISNSSYRGACGRSVIHT
jgi:hypothetical protein